ncbi:MAG: hypothetical protein K2X47_01535, partial [Bdellovibrionales bacterium]|nr:hypothetical protein [Bdellovibrionales bacterium]
MNWRAHSWGVVLCLFLFLLFSQGAFSGEDSFFDWLSHKYQNWKESGSVPGASPSEKSCDPKRPLIFKLANDLGLGGIRLKSSSELNRYFQCWNFEPCLHSTYLKCYEKDLTHVAETFGVPETAFKCLLFQESGAWRGPRTFDGGIGLGQITPPTDLMVEKLASGKGYPPEEQEKVRSKAETALRKLELELKSSQPDLRRLVNLYDQVSYATTYSTDADIYRKLRTSWIQSFKKNGLKPPRDFDLQELDITESPIALQAPVKEKILAPRTLVSKVSRMNNEDLSSRQAVLEGLRTKGKLNSLLKIEMRLIDSERRYRNDLREHREQKSENRKECAANPMGKSGKGVSDEIVSCPSRERNLADIAGSAVVFKNYFIQLSNIRKGVFPERFESLDRKMREVGKSARAQEFVNRLRVEKKLSS